MKKLLYLIVLLLLMYILYVGFSMSSGSYNDNIKYYVSLSEEETISRVTNYKIANNTQRYLSKRGLLDGKDSRNLWYFFYIYFPQKDVLLKCWIRGDTKKKTTIAIVAFQQSFKWYELEESNKEILKIIDLEFMKHIFGKRIIE